MMDQETIIKGLEIERECVSRDCDRDCGKCDLAQDRDWLLSVYDGALELLKEQEPRVMTRLEIEQSKEHIVWLEDDQFNSYALVDGIDQRNSWVWLSTVGNMCLQQRRDCENYGKRWRCWTKRPTEDQRKAVKLE